MSQNLKVKPREIESALVNNVRARQITTWRCTDAKSLSMMMTMKSESVKSAR
jgi:hypothetical protein